ncbi:glycosyl hydrolase family 88 [Caldalkalibacillus thermarum TA2.A1]|uniref:Glycoside hydrolase family 105 protein n=1 Tax=Caldalkalibacillus thermarum (strain TA2.A1) TaxID=986075 RepID=F5LAT5_CALTT|nr:glycoside hydrolase family 105 protein [Caldalkalibacillus thermarum]EGL81474.1 glycosyl hydrolase family 88 [Caldalkalibacillus thermarum TA2.A1]QZT33781.1 glycoside hydrolase family 105 protein [Caldalkalibacillus thermarum TA2.A1]
MSHNNQNDVTDHHSPLFWGERACETLMRSYSPPQLPPENQWHYHQGVYLYGMYRLWEQTGKEEYYNYFKAYVDHLVDEYGNFLFRRDELDAIQAGLLLFPLYRLTKHSKYKLAAQKLRNLFNTLNKTAEGGFWHKDKYPYQMWLDGLYMAGPFACIYALMFNEPELIDMVLKQERLMRSHMKDPQTGLYYHGWDESKQTAWSDPVTGCSPEVWGRSLGWYGMALADIIEVLPENHSGRKELIETLRAYLESVIRYQDEETGMWYQVIDKGSEPDNWLETSASCLFIYTIAKAVNLGVAEQKLINAADKGFKGVIEQKVKTREDGLLSLEDICIGTSVGVYDYYVNRERSANDLHGVGAFILACVELHKNKAGKRGN